MASTVTQCFGGWSEHSAQLFKVHLCMIIVEVCWGVLNVWGSMPVTLLVLRVLGSLPPAFLCAIFFDEDSLYDSMTNWRMTLRNLVVLVGMPQAGSFMLYHYGLHFTSAVNCALLWLSLTPLTAFLSMLLRREQRSWIKVGGVLLAVAGALVTLDLGNYTREGTSILGDILVLCAAFFYSLYIIFTKELSVGMGAWTLSTWYFAGVGFWSTLALIPIWFTTGITVREVVSAAGWEAMAIAVFLGTTLPYFLNNWALKNTSPLLIAMYTPVEMVFTAIFAAIVLDEKLKWQQGVGSVLIISGLAVVTFAKHREDKANENQTEESYLKEDDEDTDLDTIKAI